MCSHPIRLSEPDSVGYDQTTGAYRNQCGRGDSKLLTLMIIDGVSAVNGLEQTEMEPLYSVVDPDELASLLFTADDNTVQASFVFEGCSVSVTGSGEVVVEPRE